MLGVFVCVYLLVCVYSFVCVVICVSYNLSSVFTINVKIYLLSNYITLNWFLFCCQQETKSNQFYRRFPSSFYFVC